MKRREFIGVLGAGGWGIVGVQRLRFQDDVFVERWSWAMGQSVHLMLFAGSEQEGLDACAAALAELRRVESRLSLFDDASDLCELNRCAGRKPLRVDRDLEAVLALSARFRRETGGAFDVAVEPLMRAWGFHRPRARPPTTAELSEAREAVAAAVVELDG
ncbi:MAG TPA: FAD:protein FMN transferase, partial [Gemmatimonadales bacterium]|nr:FAD:protein FMN transferase [Gemmatimonadales bacterium]